MILSKKRSLAFTTALMLVLSMFAMFPKNAFAAGAVTEYDLEVGGVKVTGSNKDDILGNGEASYDPADKTLMLNKNISNTESVIFNRIDGLTIRTTQALTLDSQFVNSIMSAGDLTLMTNGELTLSCGGCGIYMAKNDSALTVVDSRIRIVGSWGILGSTDSESAEIINSTIIVDSTDYAIGKFGNGLTLTECHIKDPAGARIINKKTDRSSGYTVFKKDKKTPADKVMIVPETFDLEVCGIKVTSSNADDILGNGEAAYDPESNTLILKKDIICNADNTEGATPCISNRIEGLTVAAEGDITLTRENFGAAIYSEKDITLTGKLNVSGDAGILITGSTLTITDAEINAVGNSGSAITGGKFGEASKFVIINSKVNAVTHDDEEDSGAICCFGNGIELTDCGILTTDCEYKDGSLFIAYTEELIKEAEITNAEIYELEVAGRKVTSDNKDDILGNGEASYDPETNTLTLKKDIICNADNTEGATSCISNRIEGLTVAAEGDITLTRENFGAAIYTEEDITLTGTMDISGGVAILASDCQITIEDADITASGEAAGIQGGMPGQDNTSKLVISNSTVTATGEENGAISDFGGGIELDGSYLSSSEENLKLVIFEPVLIGDVNGDKKINVKDLTSLQRWINGWNNRVVLANCDVNKDTKINVKDLTALQRKINGWTT